MKQFRNIFYLLLPFVVLSMFVMSCDDEDGVSLESADGTPQIKYIRVPNPDAADSLLVGAELGTTIVIVGENLGGVRSIYFNDKQAELLPTWVTNRTIFATVPLLAPSEVTDKIYLTTASGATIEYPFTVAIPAPSVIAARNEWPRAGEQFVIYGDYFFEPLSVEFTGGGEAEVVSVSQTQVVVEVPDGATEGPVTVITNFGRTTSSFHFRDSRNLFLNFDEPGKTPAGAWRNGIIKSDENSLDGNYLFFQGVYNNGERLEGEGSPYEAQFWAKASGRPEGNLLPGEPWDYVMKFEINIVEWYGSDLNICFAPWDHANSNQEVWGNSFNARAVFGPWREANETLSTDGQWVTVTIPMTEFKWAMGTTKNPASGVDEVSYTEAAFNKNVTGSLSFWVLSAPEADKSPFEFYIDNVRIVAK